MTNRVLGARWMIDRRPKGEGMIKRQRCEGVSYITSQALPFFDLSSLCHNEKNSKGFERKNDKKIR